MKREYDKDKELNATEDNKHLEEKNISPKNETTLKQLENGHSNFNKAVCFANIRTLLKKSDVKIGEIEKEAGLRLGYMARLEKPDNTAEPSVEFIVTAAKLLGVTVDYLISSKIGEMTKTEKFVLKFIQKMAADTKDGDLIWNSETADELNIPRSYPGYGHIHPLFRIHDLYSNPTEGRTDLYFKSWFLPEGNTEVTGNAYNTLLTATEKTLYIIPCRIILYNLDKAEQITCYEVYMVEEDNVQPICNTAQACHEIAETVNDLYQKIMEANSHVLIDNETRKAIEAYMDSDKLF